MSKDKFNEIIKEKLEDLTFPVDDASWNEIETRLNEKKKKRVLLPWISIAAAACIAALWMIFPFNKEINVGHETDTISQNEPSVEEGLPEKTDDLLAVASHNEDLLVEREKEYSQKASRPIVGGGDEVEPEMVFHQEEPLLDLIVKPEDVAVSEKGEEVQPEKRNRNDDLYALLNADFSMPEKKNKRKKTKTSIGLSVSSGRDYLAVNDSPILTGGYENLKSDGPKMTTNVPDHIEEQMLSRQDFRDITHYAPLSFGLSVRKDLNDVFSIETGLQYTYLSSTLKNESPKRKATLRLHYIGIPLNVVATVYDSDKWRFYVSAGGMLEKGLHQDYEQIEYLGDGEASRLPWSESIDGVQWSLNVAPGAEYKLTRNYSIYLEPQVGYFFDNKQPVSIRTEHSLNVGINAGLRFNW